MIQHLPTSCPLYTWWCIDVTATLSTAPCRRVHSLRLCLYSCPALKFICATFPGFHMCVLIYAICFFLSDLLPSMAVSRSMPASPQMIQFHSFLWLSNCCSVAQSCPTLCDPMGCPMPGFPVLHHLLEFVQTHVHQVSDAIQPSHPLSSPSPPAFSLSQHQGLFQ